MKTYSTDYTMGKPYGNVDVFNKGTKLEYRKGTYIFFHGIVTFYAEPKFVAFTFVYLGRIYSLNLSDLKNLLTDRQLIIKAGKFARNIINNS